MIGNTTFDLEAVENTTTEGHDQVLEAEELAVWRVWQATVNKNKHLWILTIKTMLSEPSFALTIVPCLWM